MELKELIEEAKRRYPINTKFISLLNIQDEITGQSFSTANNSLYADNVKHGINREIYNMKTEKWAEIISISVTNVENYSIWN